LAFAMRVSLVHVGSLLTRLIKHFAQLAPLPIANTTT
jgi:hypothetical protein